MRGSKKGTCWKVFKILLIVLGGFLLVAFFPHPAEKAVTKLIQTDYAVDSPAFRDSISHLTEAPLLPGNNVQTLINGEQIFPAQLAAIAKAKKTITLENFIWRSGELANRFIPALVERARAGVNVHIIMDSMGCSKLEQTDKAKLDEAGVQFVKYNRTEWHKLFRINHRDHRKILVVDGVAGFTGGACMADEWTGNAESKEKWRDTHFAVTGPAVGQMQGVFMNNWIQTQEEVLHGPNYFPPTLTNGGMWAHCFKTGPKDGVESARLAYLYSIAAARKNIRIAHSYFVPDNLAIKELLEARKRGVKIEIITPGIIDANVVRRASRARWNELLDAGVEFYEYQPSLFHCKVTVVDDIWVMAGTVNFDNRSFRINDEDSLNVWDRDFALEQIKVFEMDKAKSKRILPEEFKNRPLHIKAAEHAASIFREWL